MFYPPNSRRQTILLEHTRTDQSSVSHGFVKPPGKYSRERLNYRRSEAECEKDERPATAVAGGKELWLRQAGVRISTDHRGEFHPMKSHTEYLTFTVPRRMDFVNVTAQVEDVLERSGVREGLLLCNAMHITASVFINDDEPGLHDDYKRWLEKLAPHDPSPKTYHHNRTGEDNGDAHHKRQIMGREVVVAVTGGKLDFGPWEQIFYGEFDGRRPKRVLVKVIGE